MRIRYRDLTDWTIKLFRYNLKIVFANKFVFFFLAAVLFFLLVAVIAFFEESNPSEATVYGLLLFPGLLLILYPTAYGIQNDMDTRMIEIVFGIPNYRYKIWLVRMGIIYVVVFGLLIILSFLCSFALVAIPVFQMVFHLMFPIFFIGCLSFMIAAWIRNGNGTAAVMVVIGMAFWIASDVLGNSKWNLFLNPFRIPSNLNEMVWADVVLKNRIILASGSFLSMMAALLNLQKREKFISG